MPFSLVALRTPWFTWQSLSWLGDTGLMVPVAVVIGLTLLTSSQTRRLALAWAGCFLAVAALVVGTKLAYVGWGIGSSQLDFTGVSGHAAFAAATWPAVFWLLTSRFKAPVQRGAIALGVVAALAIAASRLVLKAHSESEVIAGTLIGGAAAATFLQRAIGNATASTRQAIATAVLITLLVLAQHARPTPTGTWLRQFTQSALGVSKPHVPRDLHHPKEAEVEDR